MMVFPCRSSGKSSKLLRRGAFQEVMYMLLIRDLALLECIEAMRRQQIIEQEEAAERREKARAFRRRYHG
jgi:hypothetical protein